jgi:enamine deaminase RidA (YjgF/YER057c/UK114 family)
MKTIRPRRASPAARAGQFPPFPDVPFEKQVRAVMDHLKELLEAAGSNMDCLLKVIVWLKDRRCRKNSIDLSRQLQKHRYAAGTDAHAVWPQPIK